MNQEIQETEEAARHAGHAWLRRARRPLDPNAAGAQAIDVLGSHVLDQEADIACERGMSQRGDERRQQPERLTGAVAEDQVLRAVQAVVLAMVTAASRQSGALAGIHDLDDAKTWAAGSPPAMTRRH